MVTKALKLSIIGFVILGIAGVFFLGGDLLSYVGSSAKSVRTAVKDSVPIEFELRRARDLLENILPEMHGNIELIAREEVEVAALQTEIAQSEQSLLEERTRIARLRKALDTQYASYEIGRQQYNRQELTEELERRFERFRQAELVLAGKKNLLATREQSLNAARQLLEQTRSQKKLLEVKIEGLEGQYRLIQAAATGSGVKVDNSKLAQTEKLIQQIKKRLDVAERVLAHQSRFINPIELESHAVSEADLMEQIDEYFARSDEKDTVKIASESQRPRIIEGNRR